MPLWHDHDPPWPGEERRHGCGRVQPRVSHRGRSDGRVGIGAGIAAILVRCVDGSKQVLVTRPTKNFSFFLVCHVTILVVLIERSVPEQDNIAAHL